MRWPWKNRREPLGSENSPGLDKAIEATKEAEQGLIAARETRRDVNQVAESLRRLREDDPLAALFLDSLKSNSRRSRRG
jgi:hypothetical protein